MHAIIDPNAFLSYAYSNLQKYTCWQRLIAQLIGQQIDGAENKMS